MTLTEIKTEALVYQNKCLNKDLIIKQRVISTGRKKHPVNDPKLKNLYLFFGGLIYDISKNDISVSDANETLKTLRCFPYWSD